MLRSALFLLILTQFALAQSSAPPAQGHEQHQSPTQPAQQPAASPHQQHEGHSPTPAAPPAEAAPSATAPSKPVAPTAPVITLNGFCEAPATAAAKPATPVPQNCKKVITKAEFEKIIDAVIPKSRRAQVDVNEQVKQAVARQYAELLVMANEARKRGIQRKPSTQELMRISQVQVLAQSLLQDLNEKATPTPAEVAKYHSENKPAFEEAIVRRLFIPKEAPPVAPPAAGSDPKAATPAVPPPAVDPAATKAFAEKARGRAAAGEDLDKIQSDAFAFVKNTQAPPTTQLGPRRRGSLPPDHDAAVFALKPGEVSQLFDTSGGWYLYRVESKRDLPLEEVREEITRRLQPQKLNDARTAISGSVRPEFNPDYFGASPAGAPPSAAAPPAAPSSVQSTPRGPRSVRRTPPSPAQPAAPAQPPQPR
jgi:parvulin-like peptidyl-prolyl isomerase